MSKYLVLFCSFFIFSYAKSEVISKQVAWPKRMWKCSIQTLPPVLRNCTRVHYSTSLDKFGRLFSRSTERAYAASRVSSICKRCEAEYEGSNYQCDEILNDSSNFRCSKSWTQVGWEF